MASKIKLGVRPKTFAHTVKFNLVEGGEAELQVVYKYRTRSEFGSFVDKMAEAAGMSQATADEKFSLQTVLERTKDHNADFMLQILDGWELEEPLSRESLQRLADEYPGAATALMEDYRAAITQGHLKN